MLHLAKIKQAKQLLQQSGVSSDAVSPQQLATISDKLNQSLADTLNLIAFLKMGGSGFGPSPYTSKVVSGQYV